MLIILFYQSINCHLRKNYHLKKNPETKFPVYNYAAIASQFIFLFLSFLNK